MSSPGGGHGSPIPVEAAIPMAVPNPRRLPPPCWSHDDTIALIDAYRDKWYALRRGNLKANDWQDVADAVGLNCPGVSPPKTSVQCRHKMEKLRKRYRAEIQRAKSVPVSRFSSAWVHFKRLDSMEKGPRDPDKRAAAGYSYGAENNDEEEDDRYKNGCVYAQNRKLFNQNEGPPVAATGGFRIRIPQPTGVSMAQRSPVAPPYTKVNSWNPELVACDMKANFGGGASVSREEAWKKKERDPMKEMLAAVKLLGDGFVRMEQMKMEMEREMETMRMETEMKRTQMILDSQQHIVEAFAKAFSEKKRRRTKKHQQQPHQDLPKKAPDSWSIVEDFAKAFSEKRRKKQQQQIQQQPQDLPNKAPDS